MPQHHYPPDHCYLSVRQKKPLKNGRMADSGYFPIDYSGVRRDRPCKEIYKGRPMKAPIRVILQYVLDHPKMTTRSAVDAYFDQFLFSLEKQEWDGLTDWEKQQFADQLDLQNGRSPKGSGRGDDKPSK